MVMMMMVVARCPQRVARARAHHRSASTGMPRRIHRQNGSSFSFRGSSARSGAQDNDYVRYWTASRPCYCFYVRAGYRGSAARSKRAHPSRPRFSPRQIGRDLHIFLFFFHRGKRIAPVRSYLAVRAQRMARCGSLSLSLTLSARVVNHGRESRVARARSEEARTLQTGWRALSRSETTRDEGQPITPAGNPVRFASEARRRVRSAGAS